MNSKDADAIDIVGRIQDLYIDSKIPAPTVEDCVTPLSKLIYESDGLLCKEMNNLTSKSAIDFLLRQGGLSTAPNKIELNREPLAGYLYATPNFGAIFVEQSDIIVRRRFTIAHELGHLLLHRPLLPRDEEEGGFLVEAFSSEPVEQPEDDIQSLPNGYLSFDQSSESMQRLPSYEQMEQEANQFAVELLMPEGVIRSLIERYAPHFQADDLVWRLGTDMLVSRAAIRIRLRSLDLLPPPNAGLN